MPMGRLFPWKLKKISTDVMKKYYHWALEIARMVGKERGLLSSAQVTKDRKLNSLFQKRSLKGTRNTN